MMLLATAIGGGHGVPTDSARQWRVDCAVDTCARVRLLDALVAAALALADESGGADECVVEETAIGGAARTEAGSLGGEWRRMGCSCVV